jgi:hypothetical protein
MLVVRGTIGFAAAVDYAALEFVVTEAIVVGPMRR